MKNNVKLKGRLKSYLQSSLYLGFLLVAVDVLIYMIDYRAGLALSAFLILYFAIILSMMFYNKPIIMTDQFCYPVWADTEKAFERSGTATRVA